MSSVSAKASLPSARAREEDAREDMESFARASARGATESAAKTGETREKEAEREREREPNEDRPARDRRARRKEIVSSRRSNVGRRDEGDEIVGGGVGDDDAALLVGVDEEHGAGLGGECFGILRGRERARTAMDDPNARTGFGDDAVRGASRDGDDVEEELVERRDVSSRARVDDVARQYLGSAELVRQHVAQHLDVAKFRGQPGAHDVIARRHDFDAIAREVGVRLVRRHVNRLPGAQGDVIQHERAKRADVTWILFA